MSPQLEPQSRPGGVANATPPTGAQRGFRALVMALIAVFHPRVARSRGNDATTQIAGDSAVVTVPSDDVGPLDDAGLPRHGPCIVVANHPSGLLDPVVLSLALGRRFAFLGKAPLFANPIGRFAMGAFDGVALARRQDGGDESEGRRRNEQTFAACRSMLVAGTDLALFPEGISHDLPGLAPLKTGAARIALSAVAQDSGPRALSIVPVGLLYESKQTFRSGVSCAVGAPIDVVAFYKANGDGAEAVRALTDLIAERLRAVVLVAESRAVWQGLCTVAALTAAPGPADLGARHRRALLLAEGFAALSARDPAAADALVRQTLDYLAMAREVGLLDPEDAAAPRLIETQRPKALRVIATSLSLLLLAPIALLGALLCWPIYRVIGVLAAKLAAGDDDVISTYKLLGGMVLFPATWLAQSVVVGVALGGTLGAATLLLGPLAGAVALRWGERVAIRRRALRAGWLRVTRAPVAYALAARRRELALAITAALADDQARR